MQNEEVKSAGPRSTEAYRARLMVRLLRVAETVLAEEGIAAAQARRIAREADCSVGTLYNLFGDIDGLILAANERTLIDMADALSAVARRNAGAGLDTRLLALAGGYLDFATANQRRWRAIFEHRIPDSKPLPASYDDGRKALLNLLAQQLESALPGPSEQSNAAAALFAAVHGIIILSLNNKLIPFDPANCERQIQFIVSNVVLALKSRTPSQ